MRQRGKFFAGNLLDNQSVAIALTAQTGDRHFSERKRDLRGISKAKGSIWCNFRLRTICHRRSSDLERKKAPYERYGEAGERFLRNKPGIFAHRTIGNEIVPSRTPA